MKRAIATRQRARLLLELFRKWEQAPPNFQCGYCCTGNAMLEVVRYARPKDHAEKLVIIMVESPAAIANIGEIAEVPGIDVINIGTNDVAAAAGHPGEPEHPKVQALVDDAIGRILKGGKTVGLNVMSNWEKRIPYFHGNGVRWFNVHVNTFITRGANQYAELMKRGSGA